MGLSSRGFWAKVWKCENRGNYHELQISVSKKDKNTGEYTRDYAGFVRCIGYAHNKANDIVPGDSIRITNFDVSNSYSKEKNITYTKVAVFDIEEIRKADGTVATEQPTIAEAQMAWDDISNLPEEDLPFM